jgi:UDP-N-acetylmuramate dehydrogenase
MTSSERVDGRASCADWTSVACRLALVPACDLLVEAEVPLARRTTLGIGGPARLLARCQRTGGVVAVVRACGDSGVPWLMLGEGANTLVPDEGVEAVVITLEGELARIERAGERLRAGGGASLARLVRQSIAAGLAGIECLGGIPSSVGGALAMNAGAHGQEILQVLAWAEVVEGDGSTRRLERSEVASGYRWSVLGRGRAVTFAELALQPEVPKVLRERAREARQRRWQALPREPSAGSVFRNPPGEYAGRLLEAAGCRGLRRGGALVSERHANVIINAGGAKASEVRELIVEMAARVRLRFEIVLALELKVLARDGSVREDPARFG